MDSEKIILGIDPGTNLLGYGLIKVQDKKMSLITLGVLKLAGYDNQPKKLKRIFERILNLIDEYHPDELSIEAPFFGKNVQSMLKLGRAQGVCIAAALYRDVPYTEYSPRKIKQSITGNGAASKEQVSAMLQNLLTMDTPEYLDATDALAAAVCHHFNSGNRIEGKSYGSWSSFLKDNPGRVK